LSLGNLVLHNLAELARITAIATERLHEHGKARLVCSKQLQHALIEVRAMLATIALVMCTTCPSGSSSLL
jgi:hypothetical protein